MCATALRSFCLFLLLRSLHFHPLSKEVLVTEHAKFDRNYTGNTSSQGDLTVYHYSVMPDDVVRIRLRSRAANQSRPLLAVFREPTSINSLQLPIMINDYMYNSAARTLCPYTLLEEYDRNLSITVELSSPRPIDYEFSATVLDNFHLSEDTPLLATASVSEPVFYQFNFPSHLDSVVIMIESNSSICMTVSIENAECPVFDFEDNVKSGGMYQTMTKSGTITVERRFFEKFFVIFMIRPNDDDCSRMEEIIPPHPHYMEPREKVFRVTIQPTPIQDYSFPISVTGLIILVLYIAAFIIVITVGSLEERLRKYEGATLFGARSAVEEDAPGSSTSLQPAGFEYSALVNEQPTTSDGQLAETGSLGSNDSVLEPGDRQVARETRHATVADLSLKPCKQRDRKFSRYVVSLMTIAVLYGLPAVQLVLTWQDTVRQWGDLDQCWYNFRCARPYSVFFAFNNVISNSGYLFLGALLLLMVKKRDWSYRSLCKEFPVAETDYGLPRHNGLMYAIGVAVVMEGVLSASYHICPTSRNYQFDTAFMYIIGLLGMLKIYQLRHPDIIANAHVSFAYAAGFILFAMMGVYLNTTPFWIIVALCYLIIMFFVSVEFYFKGLWRFNIRENIQTIRNIFLSFNNCSCLPPDYPRRFIFLALGNFINLLMIVVGLILRPKDFPSCLLVPFIANLLLYLAYYIIMKCKNDEKLNTSAHVYLVLAVICWGLAGWFFFHNVSTWNKTPAGSRELNQDCILMSFYDNHDVWHLLSSVALFLTFSLIDCVDDDLQWVRRDKIVAF